jgi:hypothetical protein
MANLASTYSKHGWWDEAEELRVEVIETRKKVLRDEHPSTLTSMSKLAATYWKQARWDEAEELEVQVIETRKKVLGEGGASTGLSESHQNASVLEAWNAVTVF